MFEYDEADKRWMAAHHPFTSPHDEDMDKLETDPAMVRALAYDVVLNGTELGSGSIRIHRQDVQSRIFHALGMTEEEARARFGFFLEALEYGTPPHAHRARPRPHRNDPRRSRQPPRGHPLPQNRRRERLDDGSSHAGSRRSVAGVRDWGGEESLISIRHGSEDEPSVLQFEENKVRLSLRELYVKLQNLYLFFRDKDYFKEQAGITKHDLPSAIQHEAGIELDFQPFRITKWSVADLTEDHVFDTLEFLYDRASRPGSWSRMTTDTGWNYEDYEDYDSEAGRTDFREKANLFLADYGDGFELTEQGTILALGSHAWSNT